MGTYHTLAVVRLKHEVAGRRRLDPVWPELREFHRWCLVSRQRDVARVQNGSREFLLAQQGRCKQIAKVATERVGRIKLTVFNMQDASANIKEGETAVAQAIRLVTIFQSQHDPS